MVLGKESQVAVGFLAAGDPGGIGVRLDAVAGGIGADGHGADTGVIGQLEGVLAGQDMCGLGLIGHGVQRLRAGGLHAKGQSQSGEYSGFHGIVV